MRVGWPATCGTAVRRVVAVDRSPRLLEYARDADPAGSYLEANAARLPLTDAGCDLVVAYNSLMDVADMPTTVREAARVLEPGGRLCVCVTHPVSDAGRFAGPDEGAAFEITGSYFGRRKFEETFERDGLTITFRGWSSPLEEYMRAFEDAGLLVEAAREPWPVDSSGRHAHWHRLPLFLTFRLVKP